jgi:hypothetical protein
MSIIIMNFLTLFVFGVLFMACSRVSASEVYDLETIRTTDGRLYRSILILDADQHGLSFRHESGIAKVLFTSLSPNLRMLYEMVEELPAASVESVQTAAPGEKEMPGLVSSLPSPLLLTTWHRVRLPAPAAYLGGGYPFQGDRYWPTWWPRYDPVHQLANPYYREVAVRDFLYRSGLLAVPSGVRVHRCYR